MNAKSKDNSNVTQGDFFFDMLKPRLLKREEQAVKLRVEEVVATWRCIWFWNLS